MHEIPIHLVGGGVLAAIVLVGAMFFRPNKQKAFCRIEKSAVYRGQENDIDQQTLEKFAGLAEKYGWGLRPTEENGNTIVEDRHSNMVFVFGRPYEVEDWIDPDTRLPVVTLISCWRKIDKVWSRDESELPPNIRDRKTGPRGRRK